MATADIHAVSADVKWHIESIDFRAGLAFATWRAPSTSVSPCASDEWPCLFFAPPNFIPEPIGNISLALSALRGSFTGGPRDGDREASFDTPEQVAEFVRRSYVNSAGGDGADGSGDNAPFLPVDPDSNVPSLDFSGSENKRDATRSLLHLVQQFHTVADSAGRASHADFQWGTAINMDCSDSLARGALLVLRDLLLRAPRTDDPQRLYAWRTTIRQYVHALSRLKLWPLLFSSQYASQLWELQSSLNNLPWWPDWWRHEHSKWPERGWSIFFLLAHGIDPDDPIGWDRYEYFARRYFLHEADRDDPVDLLKNLPLPEQFRALLDNDACARASLHHLLAVFFSSPQITCLASSQLIDVVLFACGCVVTAAKPGLPAPVAYPYQAPTAQQRLALKMISSTVVDWMLEHMPRVVFSPALESTIAQAKSVRYSL